MNRVQLGSGRRTCLVLDGVSVAMTRNRVGIWWLIPSIVAWRSSALEQRRLRLGVARSLISSAMAAHDLAELELLGLLVKEPGHVRCSRSGVAGCAGVDERGSARSPWPRTVLPGPGHVLGAAAAGRRARAGPRRACPRSRAPRWPRRDRRTPDLVIVLAGSCCCDVGGGSPGTAARSARDGAVSGSADSTSEALAPFRRVAHGCAGKKAWSRSRQRGRPRAPGSAVLHDHGERASWGRPPARSR